MTLAGKYLLSIVLISLLTEKLQQVNGIRISVTLFQPVMCSYPSCIVVSSILL